MRNASSVIFATALFMFGSAPPIPAATPAGGERYAGKTSEALGVGLRISGNGRYVARMHVSYDVTCSDGARGARRTDLLDLRIDRHGRFGFEGAYTVRADKSKNRVRMHGTVSRRRASGSFVVNAKRKKVRCHSSRIVWHARAVS